MRLRPKQVKAELGKVKGWKLRGKRISRTFVFEDFMQVIRFVNRLAKLAESMNHHPDMAILGASLSRKGVKLRVADVDEENSH